MTSQTSKTIDLLLAESFKEIVVGKPIEKITIKEITDRAGVIRPTFYNHFQDKYELMEWIIREELILPMKPLLEAGQYWEALQKPMDALLSSKAYYLQAARLEGQNSFSSSLQAQVSELILSCIPEQKMQEKLPYAWLTPKRAADFFAASITQGVLGWIYTGMEVPKEEVIDVFMKLCSHSIEDLIHIVE
ncbi:MAG: TetR/AcrR family transcriptional regulator C-terminal domain-containing protein [Lachnospiraceae bacterium]|nr:TetR/AcrR family transcriptional regulator C-terminal domain-containing protein [Lachnospiraceae bacterium]